MVDMIDSVSGTWMAIRKPLPGVLRSSIRPTFSGEMTGAMAGKIRGLIARHDWGRMDAIVRDLPSVHPLGVAA